MAPTGSVRSVSLATCQVWRNADGKAIGVAVKAFVCCAKPIARVCPTGGLCLKTEIYNGVMHS